jgi:Ca2+-binding EF-hand superfamily protein
MFDTDGSGALGNDELKEAMIGIGLQASDEEIDELIREVNCKISTVLSYSL